LRSDAVLPFFLNSTQIALPGCRRYRPLQELAGFEALELRRRQGAACGPPKVGRRPASFLMAPFLVFHPIRPTYAEHALSGALGGHPR